jgi:CRP/FNR family cyclic AMP-dependent transcriptional regulator
MWIVVAGWLAAFLVFSSFFMKTIVPLRLVAIVSNLAFITYALLGLVYGVFGKVYPILVLHSCLLPLNVVRLRQLQQLVAAVQRATDDDVVHSLMPYMKTETHEKGTVLFRQGDPADRLYLVQEGTVRFAEIDKLAGAGKVFGEVGLFAPQGTRALTVVCEEDCRFATITRAKVLELYHQDPRFGYFLIRLVAGLVLDRREPTSAAGASA